MCLLGNYSWSLWLENNYHMKYPNDWRVFVTNHLPGKGWDLSVLMLYPQHACVCWEHSAFVCLNILKFSENFTRSSSFSEIKDTWEQVKLSVYSGVTSTCVSPKSKEATFIKDNLLTHLYSINMLAKYKENNYRDKTSDLALMEVLKIRSTIQCWAFLHNE